ncbi:MAG: PQQ-dependent sugar dehydrogenase [Acidimicrobiia bacterium]|nr:PQQ-dependent sugar dehydrogenase [Acidimicrobiia bacterium]
MARFTLLLRLMAAVSALTVAACTADGADAAPRFVEADRTAVAQGTALAADGEAVFAGERLTGRLVEWEPASGTLSELGQVPALDTRPEQRGLLGAAVAEDGTRHVAYTSASGDLVVEQVGATPRLLVESVPDRAIGGRLVGLGDGTIVVGIGDLLDPDLVADPEAPNGKLLAVEASGTKTLASGFNNPFALTAGHDGTIWVVDNAPPGRRERLLRVAAGGGDVEVVAEWNDTRVASGVAVTATGELAVCWYLSGELRIHSPARFAEPGDLIATDCRYGVVALADGSLVYAAEDELVHLVAVD